MSKQDQKYHLSLAGEFYVAAELQRRGVFAAVTYGNAKCADVIAFSTSGEKVVVIEVKSTSSKSKWVIGGKLPISSQKPWVFVSMSDNPTDPPDYYVVLQSELHDILAPIDADYRQKFKNKHETEYGDRPGVVSFTRKQAEPFRNAWWKIIDQLKIPYSREA